MILASGSPRRASILRQVGIEPEIRPTNVDETIRAGESASALVVRLAMAKLSACVSPQGVMPPSALLIAADTVVEIGGSILGKPEGKVDAGRMLTLLSGRDHRVVTGLAVRLTDPDGVFSDASVLSAREETVVSFRPLDRNLIDWYVATGEAVDKAGAYGIQGKGALLVDRIAGSYLNVVGLPLAALDRLCIGLGWPLHTLAAGSGGDSAGNAQLEAGAAR